MLNPIKSVQQSWAGPAITVKVQDKEFVIGQGTPQTTVTFHNSKLLKKLALSPSLTFGEGYMDGDIEIEGSIMDILQGFYLSSKALHAHPHLRHLTGFLKNRQERINKKEAIANAQHHYDIGNDFYKLWLDKTLAYTCAYFTHQDDSLEQAQRQKFELICRKIRLQEGHSLMDIGCGWGGFIFHAVEKYNVTATGVVAAKEQGEYIRREAKRRGIEDKVNVIIDDWRQATGTYDRVVSIGVMEHVGEAQYPEYFGMYKKLLKEDGIAFLHTIGRMESQTDDPWIRKYIFPGGHLPTLASLSDHAAQQRFVITDVENLWQHYAKTLAFWKENFEEHVPEITEMFDERFIRMWRLYLLGSEAGFRWGGIHLWQIVLIPSKNNSWPLNREVNADQLTEG